MTYYMATKFVQDNSIKKNCLDLRLGTTSKKKQISYSVTMSLKVGGGQGEITMSLNMTFFWTL